MMDASDPRSALPSQQNIPDEPQRLGPEAAAAGNDDVERYLGFILDAFPPEVPMVSQLSENPNLPWVLAGRQQVIHLVRQVREQYRQQTQRR
jgi:hypothetical protein